MKNWEKQYQANEKLLQEMHEQNDALMKKVDRIVKAVAMALAKR